MEIGKILKLMALAFALVAGVVNIPHAAAVIAVLGLVAGWFVGDEEVQLFLLCVLGLALAHGALSPLPTAGPYLTDMLASVSAMFNAAACTAILRTVAVRLRPSAADLT